MLSINIQHQRRKTVMKISKALEILHKYLDQYGDLNMAFISNNGEQNVVSNIDVLNFYDEENPDLEPENIVVIIDQFDYKNFKGAEEASDEDYANGYPGYEKDEVELPNYPYESSTENNDDEGYIPWDLM